jgi:peptide/nickel transport system permease protein
MLLAVYVTIGLLDSVHFRLALESPADADASQQHYSTEVMTLLDLTVLPLKQQLEKTYSAPFATHAFVREMQTNEQGKTIYDYAPLRYGGSHLTNPVDKQRYFLNGNTSNFMGFSHYCLDFCILDALDKEA